jgi:hypothetical protein
VAKWAQIPTAARRNTAAGAGLDPALISTFHDRRVRAAPSDRRGAVVDWALAPLAVVVVRSVVTADLPCRSGLAFVLIDPASVGERGCGAGRGRNLASKDPFLPLVGGPFRRRSVTAGGPR